MPLGRGLADYSIEQCVKDYRFEQFQGPMITVIGSMTSSGRSHSGDDMFLAMARRSCAAIRDLGSLSVL